MYAEWGIDLNRDIFKPIRNRLTLTYTIIMVIFLVAAMMISYYTLSSIIFREQKQQLATFIHRNIEIEHGKIEFEDDDMDGWSTGNFYFYYVVSKKGKFILGEEVKLISRENIFYLLHDWYPKKEDVIREKLDVNGEHLHLMIAGAPIYDDGRLLAYVYVGKEITSINGFLNMLLLIMLALSLVFLVVAAMMGNYMAGRAMVPIQQSFQRQREFVADASHELRTPLSVLMASLDVIEGEKDNRLTRFSKQVIEDMKDELKRLTRLVHELLTLARADSGSIQILKETFDLRPVLDKTTRSFRHLAEQKGIDLTTDFPDRILVYGDKERLTQLIYILLDNAVKYTPENGEVKLQIFFIGKKEKEMLKVVVEDTGMGISSKEQKDIFQRFYRVDKARSREMGGFGLGLSIAKWIIEEHEGSIHVDSQLGQGSRFTVLLPMKKEE